MNLIKVIAKDQEVLSEMAIKRYIKMIKDPLVGLQIHPFTILIDRVFGCSMGAWRKRKSLIFQNLLQVGLQFL